MDTVETIKLTPEGARKVLDTALAAAVPSGHSVSVAVCDDGGHLMAFQRADGAELISINVAINKARAAALMRFPTGKLSRTGNVRSDHHALAITLAAGTENFVTMEGGVPIIVKDTVVGGVSVSGAGKMDPELAQIGADVLNK